MKESIGVLEVECKRANGASGDATVQYKTSDIKEDEPATNLYTGLILFMWKNFVERILMYYLYFYVVSLKLRVEH